MVSFLLFFHKVYGLLVNTVVCEHCKINIDILSYGLIFISLNCSSEAG